MQNWGINILPASFFRSPTQVWKITSLNGAMGECQIALLGRCLEFHFNNAIMKIGVMQMNRRIAIGKCVDVLYSCYAQLKRKWNIFVRYYYNSVFLTGLTWTSLLCPLFYWPSQVQRETDSRQWPCLAVLSNTNNWAARSDSLQHFISLN